MSCSYSWFLLLVALPDQHQPEARHGRAIACPLQLVDHEARSGPGHGARALADPEQADGEGKQACDQQKSAHMILPMGPSLSRPAASTFRRGSRKLAARLAVASVRIQWAVDAGPRALGGAYRPLKVVIDGS